MLAVTAAFLAGAASCAVPAIDDDLGGARVVPERVADAPSDDGGTTTTTDASVPGDTQPDASPPVVTQAQLCGEPELVLCFGFEGAISDGSPNKLTPLVGGVSFVPGKLGQAASFGPASAMRFNPSPALEVTAASVEAWVKLAPNPTGDGVIFDNDNRFSLTVVADGSVLCKPNLVASTGKLVADQWTHVACVFDGATARVYVGGVEQNAGPGIIGSSPTSTAAVGGNAPSGEPFVGAIDSFRVFRGARTSAQIGAAAGK